MGLDTFASSTSEDVRLTEEQENAFAEAEVQLCGGLFSGGGSSFRGKVYHEVVAEITGASLYQDWITPDEVKKMADCFQVLRDEEIEGFAAEFDLAPSEVVDLGKFFKVCSEHNLGLIGWW